MFLTHPRFQQSSGRAGAHTLYLGAKTSGPVRENVSGKGISPSVSCKVVFLLWYTEQSDGGAWLCWAWSQHAAYTGRPNPPPACLPGVKSLPVLSSGYVATAFATTRGRQGDGWAFRQKQGLSVRSPFTEAAGRRSHMHSGKLSPVGTLG